jgi:hypothetical protein
MLFQPVFLRSMGYGGVATVAVDVIAALTVLPALLAVLGKRINALAVRKSVRSEAPTAERDGGWYRLARGVMRHPVAIAAAIVVVLLALGTPFLRISWGNVDARVLPASSTVRQVSQDLRIPQQLHRPDRGAGHRGRQPGERRLLRRADRRDRRGDRHPGHRRPDNAGRRGRPRRRQRCRSRETRDRSD